MIRKRMFAAFAVMAFGAGLAFAPAADAKNCPGLCKTAITDCKSRCQTGDDGSGKIIKKKKCNVKCKNTIIKDCKKAKTVKTACSPSGAFVD
jgi:hypothetical protein